VEKGTGGRERRRERVEEVGEGEGERRKECKGEKRNRGEKKRGEKEVGEEVMGKGGNGDRPNTQVGALCIVFRPYFLFSSHVRNYYHQNPVVVGMAKFRLAMWLQNP